METVFIDRRGTKIKVEHGRLRLTNESQKMHTSLPLRQMRALVISCDCALTSNTLYHLAKHEVAVICLNPRDIEASFISVPNSHGNIQRRLNQYQSQTSPQLSLRLATLVSRQKCRQQRQHLLQLKQQRPDHGASLMSAYKNCPVMTPAHQQNILTLMGFEGATARSYFQGFSQVFAPSWQFKQRKKRPATDAVNACLSFGYTLLYFEVLRACYAFGLDPYLGYLHQNSYHRASLACDWMELHRTAIDRWVYDLFVSRSLRVDHFEIKDNQAYYLSKVGRQHFYENWMLMLPSLKQQLRRQGRWLIRYLDHLSF